MVFQAAHLGVDFVQGTVKGAKFEQDGRTVAALGVDAAGTTTEARPFCVGALAFFDVLMPNHGVGSLPGVFADTLAAAVHACEW